MKFITKLILGYGFLLVFMAVIAVVVFINVNNLVKIQDGLITPGK